MENSNIKKQAKSDIFTALHPIINFYIKKGAKPASLKKYYKNNKRFNDLLDDIRNKGVNLVKDESEYKQLVREILNDMLDDFIASDKDKEYKDKQNSKLSHIKEFNKYSDDDEDYIKHSDHPKKRKFNVGDYVYAVKPTEYLKKNMKYTISDYLDNEYPISYELKELPNCRYTEVRFISEIEFDKKKYNL